MDPKTFHNSVLVVDDQYFVLRTTEAVLRSLGFTNILTADTVAEAMEYVSSTNPPIGLVLCDLNMPDVDGLELLKKFDEMNYRGNILLFSGEDNQTLTMAESLAKARGLTVIGALAKPLRAEQLLETLVNHSAPEPSKNRTYEEVVVTPEMLDKAIEAGELIPWFQPKIDVTTFAPVAVEALARWPDGINGPIYPGDFIPVAEKHDLINKLTFSLIAQAAQIENKWRQKGIKLRVAFNVSMNSLYDEMFPDTLEKIVAEAGGDLTQFQLEVTESQLMEDLVRPLQALLRLRMKKIRLSIDDFGTGHSNLGQLRDLPFDELKLDRSYIQSIANGERTGVILESTVEMAKKLGMSIVAEGVENLEEWERVEQLGCDQVQGYFTARPMPGDEVPGWIESWPEIRKTLFGR